MKSRIYCFFELSANSTSAAVDRRPNECRVFRGAAKNKGAYRAINHQRISTKTKQLPPSAHGNCYYYYLLSSIHSFLFVSCICVCVCCVKRHRRMNETKYRKKTWLMIYVTLAFWQSQLFALREKTSFSFVVYTYCCCCCFFLLCSHSAQSPIHPRLLTRTVYKWLLLSFVNVCSKRCCEHETVSAQTLTFTHRRQRAQQQKSEKKLWEERREKMARHHNGIRRFAVVRSLASFSPSKKI